MIQKTDNNIFFNTLSKIVESSTYEMEISFEKNILSYIKELTKVVYLERIFIFNKLNTKKEKYGQFYRWDLFSDEANLSGRKGLPYTETIIKWIDTLKKNKCIAKSIDKMSEDEIELSNLFSIKSIAIVPIFVQGDFWGVISFQTQTREVNFEEYMNLLKPFAYLCANAAVRESICNQYDKSIEKLEHCNGLSDTLNEIALTFVSQNEETIEAKLEQCVKSICDIADLDRFSIWQNFKINEDLHAGQVYRWDRETGGVTKINENLKDLPYSINRYWAALLESDNVINGPVNAISGGEMLKQFGIVSALFIPMFIKDDLWGFVLAEDRKEERFFGEEQVKLMRKAAFLSTNIYIGIDKENHLKDNLQKAKSLSKAKDDFLSKISHEIRTPMNVIMGITEIQLQNEILPKDTRESLNLIYNSGYSLLRIINDLLDLSKIEAHKLEIIPIKYEVVSLINDTVQFNIMRTESKSIEFKLLVDENIPAELIGDELRIKQVLNNILSNAFKYTYEGEVSMRVSWLNSSIIFSISDTGHGMTEEQISKIFDEYSRFNLFGNKFIEGTGLGMAIAQSLVNLMHGDISIESKIGKGSTFTVSLPQKTINQKVIGKETIENLQKFRLSSCSLIKKIPIICETMSYGKVLIVDDVESNLLVAKGIMQPYDLHIETARSGQEAIEMIEKGNIYDIIFMDHMMPKMDGVQATKILREKGYIHPIIALTANAIVGQSEIFIKNDFNDFISKPIDIHKLNNILNKFVRDKQPPEVIKEANKRNHSFIQEPRIKINRKLLKVFIQDAKEAKATMSAILENIEEATKEELNLFSIKAHAMKSMLENIAEEMHYSKKAYDLEFAVKENNREFIRANTAEFIDILNTIILQTEIKINSSEELKKEETIVENVDYLQEQFKRIIIACEQYDKKLIKAVIASLEKMTWTLETKNTIKKISELILHGDFDLAANVAKYFINHLH